MTEGLFCIKPLVPRAADIDLFLRVFGFFFRVFVFDRGDIIVLWRGGVGFTLDCAGLDLIE